jgi:putative phage-type endonuclease
MATTIIKPKSHEEWIEHRKAGIGSSEVASILGLNEYQTPYQLWRLKMGIDPPKETNMPMRLGHLLEDAVGQLWSEETGREVIKASAGDWIAVNTEKPFLRASPDRTFWLPGMTRAVRNKGILEIKTTQLTIDPEDLPKTWFCQLQYLLGVTEAEQGALAWLSMGRTFGTKDVALVPDFFGWMAEEVEKFWIDNILGGKEPEAISASDILTKYAKHTDGKIVEVSEEIAVAYSRLKEVKQELAELEKTKSELEGKIMMAFADAEAIAYSGKTLATWKAAKDSQKLDTKALAEAHPEIAQRYTITTPGSRRFLLK